MVVLLVDPDPEARAQRREWLRSAGVTVHDAADAESAVAMVQPFKHLDALVTEGWLSEQFSGFDLRDAVRQRFPALRTVFTSRYDLSEYAEAIGGCPVLYHPVAEDSFVPAVCGTPSPAKPAPAPASGPQLVEDTAPDTAVAVQVVEDEEEGPPVLSPGELLGSYEIKERLYAERDTETYLAVQQNIGRKVALVLLKPELVSNAAEVEKFKERERVKAGIEHPRIAPLYEALEIGPHLFYTRELPHGRTIEELQLAGVKFGDKILVDIVATVCEAMSHATLRGHLYRMLTARDVSVDGEHQASIVNLFRPPGGRSRDLVADVKRFLMMLRTVADGPRARHLLDELSRENRDWESMRRRASELQEEFREHSLLQRADTKEAQDIQAAHQKTPLPVWVYVLSGIVVVTLIAGIVIRYLSAPPPPPLALRETMVRIEGGDFLYQKGDKRTLPDFWMDRTEITIGQYAEFLEALRADKSKASAYDHPDQPKEKKDHEPQGWDAYLEAARTAGLFNGQPININCPVARVDWWDAYAYAKWRGNRLPTEEEWERAARGTDGRKFPWGNDPRPDAANLGADYDERGRGGRIDGFNFWAAVDKMPLDLTPEGVVGLAGNVEEWTGGWAPHPDFPDLEVPIARGGSFAMAKPGDTLLSSRTFAQSPKDSSYTRGFRTVRDAEPPAELLDAKAGR
jgi:formylglycine-generating enzyme required for sulfatase activity/CheY-like chemotaxis protein